MVAADVDDGVNDLLELRFDFGLGGDGVDSLDDDIEVLSLTEVISRRCAFCRPGKQ